jgi:hypothetical protein
MALKPLYLVSEKHLTSNDASFRHIYKEAQNVREERMLDCHKGNPDKQLIAIVEEVKLRIKITQQEIFFIGEMLTLAREILKQNKRSFSDWIDANFDFGYHTAINFCNVYTACVGFLPNIQHVKPSILYKISSKGFPKDLREILLFDDLLKDISNPELTEIYTEYQEKGFNAVKSRLQAMSHHTLTYEQCAPFIDNLRKTEYHLKCVEEKISKDTGHTPKKWIKGASPIADEIEAIVIESIDQCLKIISEANQEVDKRLQGKPASTPISETIAEKTAGEDGNQSPPGFTVEVQGGTIIIEADATEKISQDQQVSDSDISEEPTE